MDSAGTLRQLHPKAGEFCSADHVPAQGLCERLQGEELVS